MRNNSVTVTFLGVCLAAVGSLGGCQIRPGAETSAHGLKATQALTNEQISMILRTDGKPLTLQRIAEIKAQKGDVFAEAGVIPPELGGKRVSLLGPNVPKSKLALVR